MRGLQQCLTFLFGSAVSHAKGQIHLLAIIGVREGILLGGGGGGKTCPKSKQFALKVTF